MSQSEKKRELFDHGSFNKFVDEFKNESDRAAVVLGAAKLDLVLYQIIQAYLIPTSTGKDELLDGDSPLGTFSSKINICYRLGLIDSEFARALHLVRKIRNSFAHEVSDCTLVNGAHSDRVRELCLSFRNIEEYSRFKKSYFGDEDNPSIDFRATLAIMVGRLEYYLQSISTVTPIETKTFLVGSCDINGVRPR